ncbi:unnamed protein product [Brassica rapa subsp. narinosa]
MEKLKHLSLVSNICNELETHVGVVEPKDLAEKLKNDDAELPDYFVRSLLTVIHGIYPPKSEEKGRFNGLAVKVKEIEREAQREEGRDRGGRSGGDRYRRGRSRDREPELYQVYKGRLNRVMESGCFVQFDRFRGKEGLVHVSQMGAAESLVKRDMQVYVKVLSGGAKYSLSMKDVDQNTGRVLNKPRRSNPSFRTKDTIRILGGASFT